MHRNTYRMALEQNDLDSIDQLLKSRLEPIQKELNDMKKDLALLARLNQRDEIRKDSRLKVLYNDSQEA